jgi:hypothetical protein
MATNQEAIDREVPSVIYGTAELRQLAKRFGNHFFDPETLRYFGSRIGSSVYAKKYFVTSERDPFGNAWDGQRLYTVRAFSFDTATREDGRVIVVMDIETVGEFGQYRSNAQALAAIRKLTTSGK